MSKYFDKSDVDYSGVSNEIKPYLSDTLKFMMVAGIDLSAQLYEEYLKSLKKIVDKSVEIGERVKANEH